VNLKLNSQLSLSSNYHTLISCLFQKTSSWKHFDVYGCLYWRGQTSNWYVSKSLFDWLNKSLTWIKIFISHIEHWTNANLMIWFCSVTQLMPGGSVYSALKNTEKKLTFKQYTTVFSFSFLSHFLLFSMMLCVIYCVWIDVEKCWLQEIRRWECIGFTNKEFSISIWSLEIFSYASFVSFVIWRTPTKLHIDRNFSTVEC
jgi:hypothetical protein